MQDAERERMSTVDTAWLRMDRPYNLMTINGVMIMGDRLTLERVQQTIATRMFKYKRFLQRPVHSTAGFYWETDSHFEISSHIRRVGLPGAGGKVELEEFVSNLVSTPMDPTKPLWDIHVVEDYQRGSALVFRWHHCYADGIALIQVVLSMTDTTPDGSTGTRRRAAAAQSSEHDKHDEHDEHEGLGDIFRHLFHPVSEAVSSAVKAGREVLEVLEEGVDIVLHPGETVDYARKELGVLSNYARQGLGFASDTARLLLLPDDPVTRFRGQPGVAKRVAWAEPLPLAEVRTVGKVLDCSINDVLLAAATGALRDYLLEKGDVVPADLTVRAAVPVNLRPLEQAYKLGNVFGLVLLTLPIGIENPLERLLELKKRMNELKTSYQAILTLGLLGVMGLGPRVMQASAMKILSKKATMVMTNVPGPSHPLYFGGARISEMMFWVPQSGSVGMGVSILSYNNRVHFGLITDQKLVKDPEAIISRFGSEFEKLLLLTMLGPWGKRPDAAQLETILANRQRR